MKSESSPSCISPIRLSSKGSAARRIQEQVFKSHEKGRLAGVIQLEVDDYDFNQNTLQIGGKSLISFAWGGYLGLERDPRLIEGSIEAVRRYGVQFASSRAYISSPLYSVLSSRLERLFGQPVLIASTVTLGHQSCMPVLIGPNDALVLDHSCHSCMKAMIPTLASTGTQVEILPHNDMDSLENILIHAKKTGQKVWYALDGLYSMHGDYAPISTLLRLLDLYEELHLYIDDAHAMSWMGPQGTGFAFPIIGSHPRTVIALSMAKAFGAGGAIFLIPDSDLRHAVRTCGPTMIFSGPIQNPVLGACIASVDIHLSSDIQELQIGLQSSIDYCRNLLFRKGLSTISAASSPIFFLTIGPTNLAIAAVKRLMEHGFFVNVAAFPAVPKGKAGIRFNITAYHTASQIDAFVQHLASTLSELNVTTVCPDSLAHVGDDHQQVAYGTFEIHRRIAVASDQDIKAA
jgi:7-keto-8-aminopelargonate synthetase-like enzyme